MIDVDDKDIDVGRSDSERGEILLRVVGNLRAVESRIDRVRASGRKPDGVAVRGGLRQGVHAQAAAGAATVLDHYRLAERLGELLRHCA